MLIRTFLIRLGVVYDAKGMADAKRDAKDLGTSVGQAKRPVDSLEKSLDGTSRSAKAAGTSAAKAGKQIKGAGTQASAAGKQMGRLEGLIGKAGAALASIGPALAAAGLAGLIAGVGKAISFVGDETARLDKIAKGAQQTGLGIETYQRLAHVATLSGTNVDTLSKGVIKLNRNLADVAQGRGAKVADNLERLGLSFEDLQKLNPTEQIAAVADAFERRGIAELDRTTISMELFGKAGADLVPLLNSGSAAIAEMSDSVGQIFNAEELKRAEDYQDALAELNQAISFVTGSLVVGLAPSLQKGVELFERAIPPITEFFEGLYNKLAPAFDRLVEAAEPWVEKLGPGTEGALDALKQPFENLTAIIVHFTNQLSWWLEVGTKISDWLDGFLEKVEDEFPRAFAAAGAAINLIVSPLETARTVAQEVLDFVERTVDGIGDLASRVSSIRSALGLGKGTGEAGSVAGAALGAGGDIQSSAEAQQTQAADAAGRTLGFRRERRRIQGELSVGVAGLFSSVAAELASGTAAITAASKGVGKAFKPSRPRGGRGRGRATTTDDGPVGFLESLDLDSPSSVMAKRPAPDTLTIVIAPTIKLIESMTITVTGASGPEQQRAFESAADQAKDAIFVRLSELPALVENMFKLEAKALQTAGGGGRSDPGST